MTLPTNTCPRCKGHNIVKASPVTRTSQSGHKIVVAHRLACVSCAYQDRVGMFRGALSLNGLAIHDEGRPSISDEE